MKRFTLIAIVVAFICSSAWAAKLEDVYAEGLRAIEQSDWNTAIAKMKEAIALDPTPREGIVIRRQRVTYIPWYWLGKAHAELGQRDEALSALRQSDNYRVIQKTPNFADFRQLKASLESGASRPDNAGLEAAKQRSDEAMKKALEAQGRAIAAGATRENDYRSAGTKVSEANQARRLGTSAGYETSVAALEEAVRLFDSAIAASRPTTRTRIVRGREQPTPVPGAPVEEEEPAPAEEPVVLAEREPAPPTRVTSPPPEPPTSLVAEPVSRVQSAPPAARERVPSESRVTSEVIEAFQAIASGDRESSTRMLDRVLATDRSNLEALMLRGYSLFVESVMSGEAALRDRAAEDFRAALAVDPGARLDPAWFSPHAIEFLEQIRAAM
ncbi:MAG: hypothetical protein KY459_04025 [Acidobacteria bacterium]|nr:hypothetical protein [Acidobacteriota bacterium]